MGFSRQEYWSGVPSPFPQMHLILFKSEADGLNVFPKPDPPLAFPIPGIPCSQTVLEHRCANLKPRSLSGYLIILHHCSIANPPQVLSLLLTKSLLNVSTPLTSHLPLPAQTKLPSSLALINAVALGLPYPVWPNPVESERESHSVVSASLRPHGLYSPWNPPRQNTQVGSLSLLQGIFPTQGLNPGLPHCRRIL